MAADKWKWLFTAGKNGKTILENFIPDFTFLYLQCLVVVRVTHVVTEPDTFTTVVSFHISKITDIYMEMGQQRLKWRNIALQSVFEGSPKNVGLQMSKSVSIKIN